MNPGIERTLRWIESTADAKGWDRPFELLVITPTLQIHRRPCPYQELMSAPQMRLPIVDPADVAAIGYLSEAWMLKHPTKTLADAKAAMLNYRYGDITASPKRIEIRNVFAVDKEGFEYQLVRERDGKPIITTIATEKAETDEKLMDVELRIPVLIRAMMRVVKDLSQKP